MKGASQRHFGLIVAYVLPGFIGLAGFAPLFPMVAQWLRPVDVGDLGLGPPLYAVMGATTVGLILSCVRWLVLDHLHQWTGIRRPAWDDRRLGKELGGFDYLVQSHFRYYEFSGNALLAVLGAYAVNRVVGNLTFLGIGTDLGMVALTLVLFVASRDALAKYYFRTGQLVGHMAENKIGDVLMYNGNDHGGAKTKESKPQNKPQQKPQPTANPRPGGSKEKQARK